MRQGRAPGPNSVTLSACLLLPPRNAFATEEAKVITGNAALLDATALGYPLTAFIFVTLANSRNRGTFLRAIAKIDQICECHHIAGDDDYLLKARCRTTADLDNLLAKELKNKLGIARIRTTIVLATAKESVQIPIDYTGAPACANVEQRDSICWAAAVR